MKEYVLVNAMPFRTFNENAVLLVRKDRPEWQKGMLNLVGGRVEEGECPEQCALRELMEEAGLGPYPDHRHTGVTMCDECASSLPFLFPSLSGKIVGPQETVYCYNIIVNETRELKPREGETEKVAWMNWHMARSDSRLIPSLRIILPLMREGIHGWTMKVTSDIKDDPFWYNAELTLPNFANREYRHYDAIDKFLDDPYVALGDTWNRRYSYKYDLEKQDRREQHQAEKEVGLVEWFCNLFTQEEK